jgi:ATP-dependent Zn protease
MEINAKDLLTRGEKAALKRDLKKYIQDMIQEQMSDEAEVLARRWLKENKSEIEGMVEDIIRKETLNHIKGLVVTHRGY